MIFVLNSCYVREKFEYDLSGRWKSYSSYDQYMSFIPVDSAGYYITDKSKGTYRKFWSYQLDTMTFGQEIFKLYLIGPTGEKAVPCQVNILDRNNLIYTQYKGSGYIDACGLFSNTKESYSIDHVEFDTIYISDKISGRFSLQYSDASINVKDCESKTYFFDKKYLLINESIKPLKFLTKKRVALDIETNNAYKVIYPSDLGNLKEMDLDSILIMSFGYNSISPEVSRIRDSISCDLNVEYFYRGSLRSILENEYLFK